MKLTRAEQETIISFDEESPTANVYTHNLKLQKKLDELAAQHPNRVKHERDYPEGAKSYLVPKRCVSIRAPYSDERREADRQRALLTRLQPPNRSVCSTDES